MTEATPQRPPTILFVDANVAVLPATSLGVQFLSMEAHQGRSDVAASRGVWHEQCMNGTLVMGVGSVADDLAAPVSGQRETPGAW